MWGEMHKKANFVTAEYFRAVVERNRVVYRKYFLKPFKGIITWAAGPFTSSPTVGSPLHKDQSAKTEKLQTKRCSQKIKKSGRPTLRKNPVGSPLRKDQSVTKRNVKKVNVKKEKIGEGKSKMIFGFQTHAFEDTVVKENHKKSWSLRSQQISALSCTGMTDPSFLQVVLGKVHRKVARFCLCPGTFCTSVHYVSQEGTALKSWQHQEFYKNFRKDDDLRIPSIYTRRIWGRLNYNHLPSSLPLLCSHHHHYHTQGWKFANFLVLFCAAFENITIQIVWTVQHHFLLLGNHIFENHNLKLITHCMAESIDSLVST